MNETSAIIRWLPADRGGRTAPPANADRYTSVVRFESGNASDETAWSLQIFNPVSLRGNECILANIRFISEQAPAQLLNEGERFELIEGRTVVAKGVVLPQRLTVPTTVNEFELALLG